MIKVFPLVWYYLSYYKGKTLTLTVCLSVALFLPITVHWLVGILQTEMIKRADTTPLVIGPEGSRFDLVLHALYFHTEAPGTLPQAESFAVEESGYATPIPLFVRYRARGRPIVGTTLEYFSFRGLELAEGHSLTRLGDCVVGWEVAQSLGVRPGDRLLSDPENLFDLGGTYPLDMRVTGILKRSRSPDDHAAFVDLHTAWVIEGIGHGHDDLDREEDSESILERDDRHTVASPALRTHTRITPENISTFHFHGDPKDFPLTALIAVPENDRARTLLLGRYVAENSPSQALRPLAIIEDLVGMVIQLKRFFDIHHLFMLGVVALFVGLVMLLSLRLRRQEVETMFHLGCSRGTIIAIQAAELLLLLALSTILALIASWLTVQAARTWIQTLTG